MSDNKNNEFISELYKIGASILMNQFDDIEDLDLPKTFGYRRYMKLKRTIEDYNEGVKSRVRHLKSIIDKMSNHVRQ